MVVPLIVLGALLAGSAIHAGANLYSQAQQRKVYKMQEDGWNRYASDFRKNTGLDFSYPGLEAPGRAYTAHIGQNQSYASSIGTFAGALGTLGYGASKTLYGNPGRGYRRM